MTGNSRRLAALASLVFLALAPGAPGQQSASDGWRRFTATWTLNGQRQTLDTGAERKSSIVHLTGPLTLTSGKELGRGLLGEIVGFDDGAALLVARAVFTNERGEKIFCYLRAEPIGASRKATATITGGTGRFAKLEGEFSFTWQYVVDSSGDEVDLRTVDVEGRTRQ